MTTRTPTNGPLVAIVNRTTSVVTDDWGRVFAADLQIQVDRDFEPAWRLGANLVFVGKNETPPAEAWQLVLLDNSDQAGALGYHDMTAADVPVGKVFCADDKKDGLSVTVTVSHELLEMLLDPYIDDAVFVQDSATTGYLVAKEVCDAVEDDSLCYMINTTRVSDFVYPAWFESDRAPGSTVFDYCQVVKKPFELATGGYIGYFRVAPGTTGWQDAFPNSPAGPIVGARHAAASKRADARRNVRGATKPWRSKALFG
jgi:hypothetical protein